MAQGVRKVLFRKTGVKWDTKAVETKDCRRHEAEAGHRVISPVEARRVDRANENNSILAAVRGSDSLDPSQR
jgi:hypothetical protein